MISSTPFVIVDLETSGLEPALDHIIEIAAVKVLNGEVVSEWNSLVNPGIYLPLEATQIHGITSDMVHEARPFKELATEYLDFLREDSVFVAHNVDFDRNFININLKKVGFFPMPNPYLCTFKLAKHMYPHLRRFGLGNLCKLLAIELPQAHRAIHDARATAQILIRFLRVLQEKGLTQVKDIPGIQQLPLELKSRAMGQVSLF